MSANSEYMTPEEFAALPSAVHHAVWQAVADKRIDGRSNAPGDPHVYNRAQVLELARETAAARG